MRAKAVLLFLWQLPQNILALIILLVNRKSKVKHEDYYNVKYYTVKHLCDRGTSLGNYILFDCDSVVTAKAVRHEIGHQKQSVYLGWLYLFVIGLPSVAGNIVHRFIKFNYYSQLWEAWADRLGNVNR